MKKKILRTSLILISIFIVIEIILRIIFQDKLGVRKMPLIYQPDPVIGYKYIPETEAEIRRPSISKKFRINNHGFIGENFTLEKPPGTFRIIFAGDSDVTGIFTNGPECFTTFLQSHFDSLGAPIEVLNCAIDGEGRYFMDHYNIKKVLVKFDPDLILMKRPSFPFENAFVHRMVYRDYVIYYLDGSKLTQTKKYIDEKFYRFNPFTLFYDNIYSFRYFCKFYSEHENQLADQIGNWMSLDKPTVDHYIKKRVFVSDKRQISTVKESVDSLISLNHFLKQKNIAFYMYSAYDYRNDEILNKLFQKINIKYIDLAIPHTKEVQLEKDGHTNQNGHRIIARKLYSILSREVLKIRRDSVNFRDHLEGSISSSTGHSKSTSLSEIRQLISEETQKPNNPLEEKACSRVLIFSNPKSFDNVFPEKLEKLIHNRGDQINVVLRDSLPIQDLTDYIRYIVQEMGKIKPDVIFLEAPPYNLISQNNGFYQVIEYLKEYCEKWGTKQYYFNYFNDQTTEITKYFLDSTSIKYFKSGLEFNAWEWRQNDSHKLIRLNNGLLAEKFYNLIKYDTVVSPDCFADYYNVALKKLTYASNTLNEWGWHTNTAVDGYRSTYWETRGFLSLSEQDTINHREWFMVDLQDQYDIKGIIISPSYDVEYVDLPVEFTISVSTDSVKWQSVVKETGYPRKNGSNASFSFDPVPGRYVKIESDSLRENRYYGGKTFFRLSFSEFEVIGKIPGS